MGKIIISLLTETKFKTGGLELPLNKFCDVCIAFEMTYSWKEVIDLRTWKILSHSQKTTTATRNKKP